jgi:hypothetical protein
VTMSDQLAQMVSRPPAVAADLRDWSQRRGVADDPYVTGLLGALESNRDVAYWATLNPLELLPFPVSNRSQTLMRLGRTIGIVRNLMVFAPVAITWYAVGEATTAFERFVNQNATTTVNFLEFWQNGYDLLPEFWRIGPVAKFDFAIIMVVIILSLITGVLQSRGMRSEALDGNVYDRERTDLALALNRFLNDKKQVTALTMNENLAVALGRLSGSAEDIAIAAGRLEQATTGVATVTPELQMVHDKLTSLSTAVMQGIQRSSSEFTGQMNQSASEIQSSLRTLIGSVGELASLIDGPLKDSVRRGSNDMISLSDNLVATSSSVKTSVRTVQDQLEDLHRQLSVLLDRRP